MHNIKLDLSLEFILEPRSHYKPEISQWRALIAPLWELRSTRATTLN